ncbi:MAG TPA: serine/threonine-protein kinase [Steroidobacteraceae bacterium]|nr:serine/threonine-protein kinase [Steroidobacteraceae bacterium]
MNNDDALYLLGLEGYADAATVRHAYERRRLEFQQKISGASTDGLKQKYHSTLSDLDQAYNLLLGADRPTEAAVRSANSSAISGGTVSTGGTLLRAEHMSQSTQGLEVGHRLANRYEIKNVLGQGGMGAVYEAFDGLKKETIAIKVLLPQYLSSTHGRDRFMHEAKIACRLSHPNIVKVFDVALDEPYHFITMELLEGETLRQQMEARKQQRKPYSVAEVLGYAQQLIAALQYAHKQIVHRDLKPENVWVCSDGTLKLIDFGIARAFTKSALTRTGMVMGTAYYMAPEQFDGAKDVDWHADQYSLGVMLYELLAGRIPQGTFAATRELRKDVPIALSRALMTSLSTEPAARFASLAEFERALSSRDTAPIYRRPTWIWAAVAGLAAIAIGVWQFKGHAPSVMPRTPVTQSDVIAPPASTPQVDAPESAAPVENKIDVAPVAAVAALEVEVLALFKRRQDRQAEVDTSVRRQGDQYDRALADIAAARAAIARKSAEAKANQLASDLQLLHELQTELRATAWTDAKNARLLSQVQAAQTASQSNEAGAANLFASTRSELLVNAQLANDVDSFVHARHLYLDMKRQWVEFSALHSKSLPARSSIPAIETSIQPAVDRGEFGRLATTVLPGLTAQYAAALRDAKRADSNNRTSRPQASAATAPPESANFVQEDAPVNRESAAAAPPLSRREQAVADRALLQVERRREAFLERCAKARRKPEGCPEPAK